MADPFAQRLTEASSDVPAVLRKTMEELEDPLDRQLAQSCAGEERRRSKYQPKLAGLARSFLFEGVKKMSGINQITIVGNAGAAPELNFGQNNQPFCRFSVAVNEHWKTDGEKRERVTWFPVVVFNGLSEACANFIDRGRLVAIQGRVQTRDYEDREGTKHQVMQVIAEKVTFLGSSRKDDQENNRPVPGKPGAATTDDDVAF